MRAGVAGACVVVLSMGYGLEEGLSRLQGQGRVVFGCALMRARAGTAYVLLILLHLGGIQIVWLHLFALEHFLHNPAACLPSHRIRSSTFCKSNDMINGAVRPSRATWTPTCVSIDAHASSHSQQTQASSHSVLALLPLQRLPPPRTWLLLVQSSFLLIQ